MTEFEVTSKQNLVDVCLQLYGSTQQMFQLCKDNGLQIDDDVQIGDTLVFDETLRFFNVTLKIDQFDLKMINPTDTNISNQDAWRDGQDNVFEDGQGNVFVRQ